MAAEFDLMDFYEQMTNQDSDEFTFRVERKPDPGRSISAEAMNTLKDVFGAFVGARLAASLRRDGPDGPGHREVEVELRVIINGQSQRVSANLHPWYALTDGEHRG